MKRNEASIERRATKRKSKFAVFVTVIYSIVCVLAFTGCGNGAARYGGDNGNQNTIPYNRSLGIVGSKPALPADSSTVTVPSDTNRAVIENSAVCVTFATDTGRYNISDQQNTVYVQGAYFQVNDQKSTDGYTFTAEKTEPDNTLRLTGTKDGQNDIVLDVALTDAGDILLTCGLKNNTGNGVKLMQMYPMIAEASGGGIFVGADPAEKHTVLTGEGNWSVPQVKQGVDAVSKNNVMISYRNNPAMESFLIGGLTTYEFQNTIDVHYRAENAVTDGNRKSIDAKIRIYDNTGRLVDAEQLYMGDTALVNFTEKNPYTSLENYAKLQAEAMDVQLMKLDPYIYECLWYVNWYASHANNADYAVQEVKDMYAKGLANYAKPNLRVEPDTYLPVNEQLWWDDAHWKDFGHMTDTYPTAKKWIEAMKAVGGDGGLYMQASYRSDDYCNENPGHMLHNDAAEGPDYTDSGFIKHMQDVYANLKDAGVRSLFFDYTGQYKGSSGGYLLDKTGGFEDPHATAVSAYRNIFALAKQNIGRDVRITENSWEYSGADLAIGLIDFQRNIHDTNEFSIDIARTAINQWYRHRTPKLLYPDVKVFESNDIDLRRAQITGTAFFYGKMTLGESVNRMSQSKIKDIGRSVPFPINGISARPVGLFDHANAATNPDAYDYKFKSDFDDHILLLWNQTNYAKKIDVNLGENTAFGGIGLNQDKYYDVWDFWNWRYVGRVKGNEVLSQSVRKNEMRTLAVREVRNTPYLLSTDRHLLQGDIDAHNIAFDAQTNTLTGTFDVVANDTYKAIIPLNGRSVTNLTVTTPGVDYSYRVNERAGYAEILLDAPKNTQASFILTVSEANK